MNEEVVECGGEFKIIVDNQLYKSYIDSFDLKLGFREKYYVNCKIYKEVTYKFLWFKFKTFEFVGEENIFFKYSKHFRCNGKKWIRKSDIRPIFEATLEKIAREKMEIEIETQREVKLKKTNFID